MSRARADIDDDDGPITEPRPRGRRAVAQARSAWSFWPFWLILSLLGLPLVFVLLWAVDAMAPSTAHRAVAISNTVEIDDSLAGQVAASRRHRESTFYRNRALGVDGRMLAYGDDSVLGPEVQRRIGYGDPLIIRVSALTGRAVEVRDARGSIDLVRHRYMLMVVGGAGVILVAGAFFVRFTWRSFDRSSFAAVVGAGLVTAMVLGGWWFGYDQRAVRGPADRPPRAVPGTVVAQGDVLDGADWQVRVERPVQRVPAGDLPEGLRSLAVARISLEMAYSGDERQSLTGVIGGQLRAELIDAEGARALPVDAGTCGSRPGPPGLPVVETGRTDEAVACFVLPDGFEPRYLVTDADTGAALAVTAVR